MTAAKDCCRIEHCTFKGEYIRSYTEVVTYEYDRISAKLWTILFRTRCAFSMDLPETIDFAN